MPLSDLVVDDELADAVNEVVRGGWWSMGPRVAEFESNFAQFLGSKHALAVANGTAALELALRSSGCGAGDEVILPSLNFVAAANAIVNAGATPVFCDVRSVTDLNMDPASVESAVTPATKAILVLHYGGYPCDIDAVAAIAERHGLIVLEDAAHAPGATLADRRCGTFGLAGCFSFFSNKNLPVGEGGMLVTDDDDLAARARLLRSHGMTTLTWDRHRGHAHRYDVVVPGFNLRLDEIHAAIGLVQLRRLPDENAARGRLVDRYRQATGDVEGVEIAFASTPPDAKPSFHLATAIFESNERRDHVRTALTDARIQTSIHYPPIHSFTAYADRPVSVPLAVTEQAASRLLTLPLYARMGNDGVDRVADGLAEALR